MFYNLWRRSVFKFLSDRLVQNQLSDWPIWKLIDLLVTFRHNLIQWQTKTNLLLNNNTLAAMFVIIQRIQKSNGNCSLLVQQIFTIPGILFSVSTNSKNTHHILKYISSIIFDQFDSKQIGELSGKIFPS